MTSTQSNATATQEAEHDSAEALFIQVKGVFDAPAAARLQASLARADPQMRLRIDLSQVPEFQDHAIAALAGILSEHGKVHVELRGLRQHQLRLLRYFGVQAEPFSHCATTDLG